MEHALTCKFPPGSARAAVWAAGEVGDAFPWYWGFGFSDRAVRQQELAWFRDVRAMRECERMVLMYTRQHSMTLRANVELFL